MVGNNLGGDLISVQVTNSVVLGLSKSISNQNFAFHFHPFLSFALCLRKPNENLLNLDVSLYGVILYIDIIFCKFNNKTNRYWIYHLPNWTQPTHIALKVT